MKSITRDEYVRRQASLERRQHLPLDDAFECFITRLRGSPRGRKSRRQDLIRMFWHWHDCHYDGPLFARTLPLAALMNAFRIRDDEAIDSLVSRFFCCLPQFLRPALTKYVLEGQADAAVKALSDAAGCAKRAYNRRDNKAEPAIHTWEMLFGRKFPTNRSQAGLPLLP